MANNKQHDNRGISPADQEALGRIPARPAKPGGEAIRGKEVPISQTKPGRRYDRSTGARPDFENEAPAKRTDLGDTYESNDSTGSTTHRNK